MDLSEYDPGKESTNEQKCLQNRTVSLFDTKCLALQLKQVSFCALHSMTTTTTTTTTMIILILCGCQLPLCPSPTSFLNAIHTNSNTNKTKNHIVKVLVHFSHTVSDCLRRVVCVLFFFFIILPSTGIHLFICMYRERRNVPCRRPLERQRQIK